jgi:flagellar basal body-associated protein FliL
MSEETQEQEGTMSGLKKTLIGAVGTIVTAGGVWAASLLGGGDKAEPAPVQAAPVINITNSQTQQQSAGGGKTVIIKEKETVKEPAKPVKKKEGDEFKEEAPKW